MNHYITQLNMFLLKISPVLYLKFIGNLRLHQVLTYILVFRTLNWALLHERYYKRNILSSLFALEKCSFTNT